MEISPRAENIIRRLNLQPHPEGGFYRETFRDQETVSGRSRSTAIYYLLPANQVSRWHRVDAVEIWHWYDGAPLLLKLSEDGKNTREYTLGPALGEGQQPQIIVPPHVWQSARSLGEYTLVGWTVAPGFEFSGFEIAPEGCALNHS